MGRREGESEAGLAHTDAFSVPHDQHRWPTDSRSTMDKLEGTVPVALMSDIFILRAQNSVLNLKENYAVCLMGKVQCSLL